MRVAVAKEVVDGERRVALVPESVKRLGDGGWEVRVAAGAGVAAGFTDAAYTEAGARIVTDPADLYRGAQIIARVQAPGPQEVGLLDEGSVVIGFLKPLGSEEALRLLAQRNVTAFAMELIPRITRAQKMDALSSQANLAGYKAAVLAANRLGRIFPMLMTAAGTIAPAKVLVLGAGVAGLQAIATARRLGGVVSGYDIRPEVKEQVESLGATYVGFQLADAATAGGYAKEQTEEQKQQAREHLAGLVRDADVVITTAQVPGRKAPVLVTRAMVEAMKPGSVIVDLAADGGGNCELTVAGQDVEHGGVTVMGPRNVPSMVPFHASQMYARNVVALLQHLVRDGALNLDFTDEITRDACVTHDGRVVVGGQAGELAGAASNVGG
jgi:H+-translocating NAD(P) transhydrogenase subunit alpha